MIPLIFLQPSTDSKDETDNRERKRCDSRSSQSRTVSELKLKPPGSSSIFPGNMNLYLACLSVVVGLLSKAASPDAGEGANETKIDVHVKKEMRLNCFYYIASRILLPFVMRNQYFNKQKCHLKQVIGIRS